MNFMNFPIMNFAIKFAQCVAWRVRRAFLDYRLQCHSFKSLRSKIPDSYPGVGVKAIFHCSRFARAGDRF